MADPSAFIDRGELVKHLEGVRRLARHLVRDDADADDVMQDTAVAALENERPVRKGLGAWLSGVTRNIARTRHRGDTRRTRREEAAAQPEAVPSAAESVVRAAEQSALLETVVNMEDPYRTAILLRFVEGLPPREIAARMDMPVETVRTHVKRGLARLRGELDRRHGGRDMWRATLFFVAGGVPYRAAPAASASAAKKAVVGAAAFAAACLAAWWIWSLVTDEPGDAQPPIEIATDGGLSADGDGDGEGPEEAIVVRDAGVEPPAFDLRDGRPPPEVREPELIRPPEETSTRSAEAPRAEVQPDGPKLDSGRDVKPRRIVSGVSGRLQSDTTGGRVAVPAARAWIGTPQDWIEGIAQARRGQVPIAFGFEAPRHIAEVERFEIDLYEVTNAQYQRFLHLAGRRLIEVGRHASGTMEEIVRRIVVRDVPTNLDWVRVARQLYESNFAVLQSAHPSAVVRDPDGRIDHERTFERLRRVQLRRRLELVFYDRAPPGHWPSMDFPKGEAAHPVRDVSYEEAQAFAMWAGKHLPTEIEWEYACRGMRGAAYPWGGKPTRWDTRVNGGFALPRGESPMTFPYNSMPDGQSEFGLFHTLGNVSEWTSSFLVPYPGAPTLTQPVSSPVVVIRGGSAADFDRLRVRPAFRGWRPPVRDENGALIADFTPDPRMRREWTGFRCAVYEKPAQSRLPAIHYYSVVEGVLPLDSLSDERWSGAEHRELIPPGTAIENGIFVPRPAYAFTAVALKRLALRAPRGAATLYTLDAAHGIKTTEDLLSAVEGRTPVLLGMIQSDTTLGGLVAVRGARASVPPTRTRPVSAPAGTYYVALMHSRLAIVTPDLRFAYYFTPKKVTRSNASVVKRKTPARGEVSGLAGLELNVNSGYVRAGFEVPLGASGEGARRVVRVHFAFQGNARIVNKVSPWRVHRSN